MNAAPITAALLRHQARRAQNVPTVSALVGPRGLGLRAWRAWAEVDQRPCAIAFSAELIAVLEAWVGSAFSTATPAERAVEWLAAVTKRDAEALAREVERMTRYDLDVLWRALPIDPHAPGAIAAHMILSDRAVGTDPHPAHFVRAIASTTDGLTKVVRAITALYPPNEWPALLLVPAPDELLPALRLLESIATTEPRVPVALALDPDEYERFGTKYPDARVTAFIREGLVEVRGVSGNELNERLRGAGLEPPATAVDRLAADGLADEVATAFVDATRAVRAPTATDLTSDFRSVHEEFLFGQLESMPQTAGLFRPNRALEFRHGNQAAEADLLAETLKLVIEVDGAHYHLTADQFRRDRRKDWLYQKHGYMVLRFLAEDVVSDLELVLNTILEAVELRRASAHPTGAA
ncbi:DUF559 domain-containing protein [Gemmata sp. G18]|uniref:DUF559 domain-containing protein n=1 Tax=Gemmata palustris TaxID=2822762 RepID=A0ABS5BN05_9BACT|nr:DUF559 domain-containing protein [Gemmata palustris]MBP3955067.1 DUF559 domain-containing protein [Gemmata palustris]